MIGNGLKAVCSLLNTAVFTFEHRRMVKKLSDAVNDGKIAACRKQAVSSASLDRQSVMPEAKVWLMS